MSRIIYAECCMDYDCHAPVTKDFYTMMQNRFHYAITGHTAAEIVYEKADSHKGHMRLLTWRNAPDGRIRKADVVVAKNYLSEKEIRSLERAVTGFFAKNEERFVAHRRKAFARSDEANTASTSL